MKISKKFISTTLLAALTILTSSQLVSAHNLNTDTKTTINEWPGRPGGNVDGSEEYLDGNYGEMNGPYKKVGSNIGTVKEFNSSRDIVTGIAFSAIGIDIPSKALSISFSLAGTILNDHIEGIYYKSTLYVSGRRAKLAIQTYRDEAMTQPYKYYEEIKKW